MGGPEQCGALEPRLAGGDKHERYKNELGQHLAPRQTGGDELVPSRYALKVGEIEVMVVSDGVLSLPGPMLGHNVDAAVRGAWLEDNFLPPDVLEWALNVVVVRSGGDHTHRRCARRGPGLELAAGRAVDPAIGSRQHRSPIRDRRSAYSLAYGPHWWAARRRGEGPAASGPAGPPGGRRG
jgi:hypothetical protein